MLVAVGAHGGGGAAGDDAGELAAVAAAGLAGRGEAVFVVVGDELHHKSVDVGVDERGPLQILVHLLQQILQPRIVLMGKLVW